MNKILDGKKLSIKINEETKKELSKINRKLKIVTIQVGSIKESNIYIKRKKEIAEELGMLFEHINFPKSSTEELVASIKKYNNDSKVDGIIVQLPLPKNIDMNEIYKAIDPSKDIDGFNPYNKGLLDLDKAILIPPTALGIIELLKSYNVDLLKKNVVILGSGEITGKPLLKLFLNNGSTVTICNKNTEDIYAFTKTADILVSCVGEKHIIEKKNIKKDSILVNVGIKNENGVIYGDINFDDVLPKVSLITPIIGGTGPMTIALLMRNTLLAYKAKK